MRYVRYTPRILAGAVLMGAVAFSLAQVPAQAQASSHTRTADVKADKMVYKWQQNLFEFTGNCVLTISAGNQATMTAPEMTVQLSPNGRTIRLLKAKGPLVTTVITTADAQGVRRKVVARCSNYATYSEADEVVEMSGGASADLVTLPETPTSARAHFSGDLISVSLKSGELTATQAKLHVEGEFGVPGQGAR